MARVALVQWRMAPGATMTVNRNMKMYRAGTRSGVVVVTIGVVALSAAAFAQEAKKPDAGVVGQPWTANTKAAAPADGTTAKVFDAAQIETIKKVSGYFNTLNTLKGSFIQTNAANKRERGKFYVKRPGRFRFDYALPSKQIIISDGKYLAIQDLDLKNEDTYELDNTPFRLLLKKDVDLMRDALIGDVQEADDLIVISLKDKSPDAPGAIKLFLAKKPTLELKEWVTSDAQGGNTRVELSELNKTDAIEDKLFIKDMMVKPH
jgi:outer membrane lipoprotein-sorting protein